MKRGLFVEMNFSEVGDDVDDRDRFFSRVESCLVQIERKKKTFQFQKTFRKFVVSKKKPLLKSRTLHERLLLYLNSN